MQVDAPEMLQVLLLQALIRLPRSRLTQTGPSAMADPAADALARLFGPAPPSAGLFAPAFLAAIPLEQVAKATASIVQEYGPFMGVIREAGGLVIHLGRADVMADVILDDEGRIARLLFKPGRPAGGTLQGHVDAVAALPGHTAVLVTTDGRRRGEHGADRPLAVGSAFKLAVLRAVDLAVARGALAWDQVVPLDPAWRSLGSGILREWPDGTPVTLATLANLMISVSDNTAADALIHLAGRAAVQAVSPRNDPFLTTREAFIIKADSATRADWLASGPAARLDLLRTIAARPLPTGGLGAVTSGVEWFMTAAELATLLDATHGLPPFRIHPGPVPTGPWTLVAFKGGSEPGVLNLSVLVASPSGARHCIVLTWNDDALLDEERLLGTFEGLLHGLQTE